MRIAALVLLALGLLAYLSLGSGSEGAVPRADWPAERLAGLRAAEMEEGGPGPTMSESPKQVPRLELSEEAWRARLSEEQYAILREKGTERRGSSSLHDETRAGLFACAGCGLPLFSSDQKYESRSGWPSFWAPVEKEHLLYRRDDSWWMTRTEVLCAGCDGHLGHVFDDGPEPTGLRFCLNGAALDFHPGPPR